MIGRDLEWRKWGCSAFLHLVRAPESSLARAGRELHAAARRRVPLLRRDRKEQAAASASSPWCALSLLESHCRAPFACSIFRSL
eukprot:2317521-Pleurochrysis_carterae.AAC.7